MTIRHMKIFAAVYRQLNITRAAEQLHMTQPAVTRAIQEIESYYGVCLFERINRRLSATENGKHFYARAIHIADAFDAMETELRNWDTFGVLRVGASVTLGNFLLPGLVCAFGKEHPQMTVRVSVANGASLQRALMDNQLDLALIEGGVAEPELHAEPFAEDRLVLLLPPGHELLSRERIELAQLAAYPLLLREQGSAGRSLVDHAFAARGITLRPLWESISTQAILQAVACGLGLSFLPERLALQDIQSGKVCTREIADEPLRRKNDLVWHRDKFLTASARRFVEMCKALEGGARA
ncbi:MAG: LysR family transcriptional regulator [Clostridia bacterium]